MSTPALPDKWAALGDRLPFGLRDGTGRREGSQLKWKECGLELPVQCGEGSVR